MRAIKQIIFMAYLLCVVAAIPAASAEKATRPELSAYQHILLNDKLEWLKSSTESLQVWNASTTQFVAIGQTKGLAFSTLSYLDKNPQEKAQLDSARILFAVASWSSAKATKLLVPTNEMRASVTFVNARGETVFAVNASKKNRDWKVALQRAFEDCYEQFLDAYPGFDKASNALERRKLIGNRPTREMLIKEMDAQIASMDFVEGLWATVGNTGEVGAFEVAIRKHFNSDFADYSGVLTRADDRLQLVGHIRLTLTKTAEAGIFQGMLIEPNMASRTFDAVQTSVNGLKIFLREKNKPDALELMMVRIHPKIQEPDISKGAAAAPEPVTDGLSVGSSFLIDSINGLFATNWHVIEGAKTIRIRLENIDEEFDCDVAAKDVSNDLAILKARDFKKSRLHASKLPYAIKNTSPVRESEKVLAVGFPLSNLLGIKPRVTEGTVSSRFGPGDDPRYLQISAPIQPGNSGGPLVNERGQLVGVIVATLKASEAMKQQGVMPQNVNFAVKSIYLISIAESIGAEFESHFIDPDKSQFVSRMMDVTAIVVSQ
jgi:S1-C subfamily serine protease